MIHAAPQLNSTPPAAKAFVFWLTVICIGVAFYSTEQNLTSSKLEAFGTTADRLEEVATGEKFKNVFGFSLIALVGGCLVVYPSRNRIHGQSALALLIAAFLLWCVASTLWTTDTWTTTKRVVILLFCALGALGVAKHLSARQLLQLTLAIAATTVALGVAAELVLGTFRPWRGEYRFAGTMHPNGQADNCAVVCLASVAMLSSTKRGKGMWIALFAIAAVLLVLTKSRSATIALLGGLAMFFSLRASTQVKWAVGLATACAASLAILAVELLDAGKQAAATVLMGRTEHIGTLTGRTELWDELMIYIHSRPMQGYGYGGFWSAARIEDVSSTLFWGVSTAHSAYFETILNIGLVGMALLLLIVVVGMFRSAARARATGDTGYAFLFALLVFAAINGITEAGFFAPSFLTWVAGCGLVQLAFVRSPRSLA